MIVSKKRFDAATAKLKGELDAKIEEVGSLNAQIVQLERLLHRSAADEERDGTHGGPVIQQVGETIDLGRQFAAAEQIKFFTAGAAVPYYVDAGGCVMAAQITDPYIGTVVITFNEQPSRVLQLGDQDKAIDWFSDLVNKPASWATIFDPE